jgi:hypothetical protein
MPDVKLTGPSMEQRIANRLRNSGEGSGADTSVQHGTGPTRTHTNIHRGASQTNTPSRDDNDGDR